MTGVFPELYTKGSRVWIKHQSEVWQCAIVKINYNEKDKRLIVDDEEGQEVTLPIDSPTNLPPLRNPDILIGANDLTSLSYLHEPAVLYNLRVRFLEQNAIYTWCGIVLVAINPFADLEIYGEETIQTYHESTQGTTHLDPHIYAVAEDAYSKLERDNYNQSVIVSGESGAGKTVSAKFAMRYFASIAGSQTSNIENRVLASNPIMEAIGNAKTTRNDNSSRFGKYIQILFDPQSRAITGGNMRTYLLEKSRVSRQNEGERNFHIFYQMCTFAQENKLKHLKLESNYQFAYLGEIEPTKYDDLTKFNEAMQCLGFSEKQQNLIYKVIAAILHGGNIDFVKDDKEGSTISNKSDLNLSTFCELLGLDETATRQWLTHRLLRTGTKEVITTSLNADMALYGRDGLVKFIYEKLFQWIVALINKALGTTAPLKNFQFIGVLDIYGFEHFETNSFEQFCINYANEVLQQQFNQHVFKLEQEEYIREGIDWQMITFTDNQQVIDLIEAKPIGILNLLDEECKMPKGTDETWGAKLYAQLTVGEVFQKPKFGFKNSFIIQHFADKVTYQVEGFLEKNRDTIWEEQIDLLKRSTIIDCLFIDDFSNEPSQKSGGKVKITPQQQQHRQQKQAKATVGFQFRESLADLMRTLNTTEPHYVRCIKPNDFKEAFEFNNIRAVQQLRACGVLETIRISSNGFPSRWSYQDFANRYRVLRVGYHQKLAKAQKSSVPKPAPRKLVRAGSASSTELRSLCEEIVKIVYEEQVYSQFKIYQEQKLTQKLYQFGKTKIFFRSGQVALLERIRAQKLTECAILLQRMIRGYIVRSRYIRIRQMTMRLQCYARGYLARKLYLHLKQTKAATVIQTKWRSWNARQKYLKLKKSVLGIQRFGRGVLVRRRFMNIKKHLAAITIQKHVRGFLARRRYEKERKKIITVQSLVRKWLAKRELKKLKIEARSVEHVTSLNRGLERKIIELQQKIEVYHTELKGYKQLENEMNEFKKDSEKIDLDLKNVRNLLKQRDDELTEVRSELTKVQGDNTKLGKQIEKYKDTIERLKVNNAEIKTQADPKLIKEAVEQHEKLLIVKFEKERKKLVDEMEKERESRQQLLRKYMALEEKVQSGRGEDEEERTSDISVVSLMMRCSELEQECAKFKQENQNMRELLANLADKNASDDAASMLAKQCADMQLELDRSREERSQLKTIVLTQESSIRDPNSENELISAFKAIIKQLENEVDEDKLLMKQYKLEIESLKNDNNRQQQLIGINSATILAKGGDDMVTKIGQENTLLREKCDKLINENKQLKMEMMRRNILENDNEDDFVFAQDQNSQFLGMFEYKHQNESLILKILISDLDPNIALKFPPHIPSYIIFMCIRYTDYNNDDVMVRSLLNNTIIAIKRTIKKSQNIETFVLWLSNTCKLITCLKQYSGEEIFGNFDESLKNFDLSEYRQIFSDIAIWIYQGVVKHSEERIQSMIVPAILEHEGLASSGMYSQSIQRTGSVSDDTLAPSPTEKPIDALIKELSYLNRILLIHVIEPEIIHQIFRQLFYFICAGSLNNLLLRKDLCHWNKAMQIRFNLSSLEQWCREQQIPKWNEVVEKLEPIIQATKLLQTRKTEEHIQTIVEMCNKLSSPQIIKILNSYTAGDEERISSTFIKKVQQYLAEQRTEGTNATLLMDTKHSFAFTIPYNPSDVKLHDVNLPPVLVKKGLATVLRKV